ncbi:MAG: rod shape-determining protein RodA [Bacteroidales bacterium]|nr:MAG: rod shape-determining protein RodA [Bacteroidales bacterium]
MQEKSSSALSYRQIDKPLLLLYFLFLIFGWICIYEASYSEAQTSMFDIGFRSGMQLVWISISIAAAIIILNIQTLSLYSWSYFIYATMMILLVVTIFIAPNIKGSHSWIVLGGFSIQPAEFAKFATALAVSYYLSSQRASDRNLSKKLLYASGLILLPMIIIMLQNETGSALVFVALTMMLFREGLSPYLLGIGVMAIAIFIITIVFLQSDMFFYTSHLGLFASINIALLICVLLYGRYSTTYIKWFGALHILGVLCTTYIIAFAINRFFVKIDMLYISIVVAISFICLMAYIFIKLSSNKLYLFLALFMIGAMGYAFSSEFAFKNILKPHQRVRIEILLGLKEDPKGAEWNTIQSRIAISSGRLTGKGFLKGTQTKLKFVPEQDTDFVFCTIGEELGFLGSATVVFMFIIFIYRIIYLSEQQSNIYARVYGYCVASIFTFHILINIGMVLGIMPVIGIPLPFFSYGGSSLLSFTVLLFIFIKLDMSGASNTNYLHQ